MKNAEICNEEHKTVIDHPKFVIPYHSQFRLKFDIFIVVLSIYNCIMIPLELSIGQNFF
jgi:hypothetical protein